MTEEGGEWQNIPGGKENMYKGPRGGKILGCERSTKPAMVVTQGLRAQGQWPRDEVRTWF